MSKHVWTAVSLLVMASARFAGAEWYDDMKLGGDFRYRFEQIKEEGKDDRQRDRIRARVGVFPRVNTDLDVGIQLTTDESKFPGVADPISGNQTLTDEGSKKGVYLDLAYMDWHPHYLKGFDAFAGKMKSPFIAVAPDWPFDPDYNPEGLGAKYHVGDEFQFLANAGYNWLFERAAANDTKMYGGQVALNFKPSEKFHAMVGGSVYGFSGIEGNDVLDYSGANKSYGNSTVNGSISGGVTNKAYAQDYRPVEGFVEIGFNPGIPVTFYGSYLKNNQADADNKGYIGGVRIGQAKDPGQFELSYDYRNIEKDAFLGALVDSDSFGGGTDGKGHKITAKYQLMKNWQAAVAYFIDEKPIDGSKDYNRLQVDLVAKF